MRGTRFGYSTPSVLSGIIPAYAGNTMLKPLTGLLGGDHPRVCGEHLVELFRHLAGLGSSPRMRGTPDLHNRFVVYIGIIPAYAGNT